MKSLRALLVTIAMATVLAMGVPSVMRAEASEPADVRVTDGSNDPWIDPQTGELMLGGADPADIEYGVAPSSIVPLATGPAQTAGTCKYHHQVDDPHVTGNQSSVHGWWTVARGSGACPSTATVKVKLQAWGCYDGSVCGWRTVITSSARSIKPGTAKRANAQNTCGSAGRVSWRGQVDVDLDWWVDPFGWFTESQQLLNCYPSK